MINSIPLHDAIKKMRQLTELCIPFSIEFYSYNTKMKKSSGYRIVDAASLRSGLRKDKSGFSETLIAYTNETEGTARFFHISLLMKFNGLNIVP